MRLFEVLREHIGSLSTEEFLKEFKQSGVKYKGHRDPITKEILDEFKPKKR